MESITKNKKTREQIFELVKHSFGSSALSAHADAVSEMKDGWFNATYEIHLSDGSNIILKIAPPVDVEVMTYEKNIMATEVSSMRLVAQNPFVPVPKILNSDATCKVNDSAYFFMEKLPGKNLAHHVEGDLSPELQADIERQIGAIIREVNGFTGTFFGYEGNPSLRGSTWKEAFAKIISSVIDDGLRKNADFGADLDEIRDAIRRHLPCLEIIKTPSLVHWDAWHPNFFVENGKISGIIDFERALWADPLLEAQFRALGDHGLTEAMKGYGKTSFDPGDKERCWLYTLHLGLVMRVEDYYRNSDSDFGPKEGKRWIYLALKALQQD